MREIGARLRAVRLERGEDLDDVAQQLRIKAAYLFAIEQGDLSALPGRTYALGFLRTYAGHLGFDGADLIARIRSSVGELPERTRLSVRAPVVENRLPRTPIVVISLALVAGIYLGWSYVSRTGRPAMDTVAEVPAELRPATAAIAPESASPREGTVAERADAGAVAAADPGASSGAAAARPDPAGSPAQPGPLDDAPVETMAGASPPAQALADDRLAGSAQDALALQPAAGAEPSAAPTDALAEEGASAAAPQAAAAAPGSAAGPTELDEVEAAGPDQVDPARQATASLLARAPGEGARVYGRANADARVILRAREPAWIQVSSAAGDYTFTRTLEPGEAVLVPNRPDLELWTGNAHGLEIIVDGAPVALAPGPMVRRHISLDPERLSAANRPR